MKIALVYDRVVKWGGAERVLLALHRLFPDAPLFTGVYDRANASWADVFDVHTTFADHIPTVKTHHEYYPWLMAFAFESLSFDPYDLVISVTSAEAKGIITKPHTKHICYCLTPTRYLWSHEQDYFSDQTMRTIVSPVIAHMKRWDVAAAQRPDVMIAISTTVQERIKTYYGRESEIIHPPVGLRNSKSLPAESVGEVRNNSIERDFFLVVSRLVKYKKVDVVIDAFNQLGLPLIIVGQGREENYLKKKARTNISFIHALTDEELSWYYQHAQALILAQEEDFGLVSVESQMNGTPVIAFAGGGNRDTVVPGKTGLFFHEQTPEALMRMIQSYNKQSFNPRTLMNHAKHFSDGRFEKEFSALVNTVI